MTYLKMVNPRKENNQRQMNQMRVQTVPVSYFCKGGLGF